jgi:hypothetical protein
MGLKVCSEVWDDHVAILLPGNQAAGSYKALISIYQASGVPRGGGSTPRNSEVLTKLIRIPSSMENTSITT